MKKMYVLLNGALVSILAHHNIADVNYCTSFCIILLAIVQDAHKLG